MRIVIQRVNQARVEINQRVVGQINRGLLVYLGVGRDDTVSDAEFIADKIAHLRIFADEQDKMNLNIQDIGGAVLLVSQFTLQGDCRRGRRPGFDGAAEPEQARRLYDYVITLLQRQNIPLATGIFAAHMQVSSINDGPVTFILDSKRVF